MNNTGSMLDEVKAVLARTLGIEDRADALSADTQLLDSLPELDSMSILNVMLALEEHFGITIEDDDINGDVLETLGTLTELVKQKLK